MLSDEGSRTITAWGLLNQHAIGRAAGIPYPGTFVLDRKGIVRTRVFEDSYEERVTAARILSTLQASATIVSGEAIAGKYIAVRAIQSDRSAATGEHLTLGVEVTPGPKVHVYAPGQPQYIPILADPRIL